MSDEPPPQAGAASESDAGTSLLDGRRAGAVAVLALVVVLIEARFLGTVASVPDAAIEFAIVAVGGYVGLTAGDALLDRFAG